MKTAMAPSMRGALIVKTGSNVPVIKGVGRALRSVMDALGEGVPRLNLAMSIATTEIMTVMERPTKRSSEIARTRVDLEGRSARRVSG